MNSERAGPPPAVPAQMMTDDSLPILPDDNDDGLMSEAEARECAAPQLAPRGGGLGPDSGDVQDGSNGPASLSRISRSAYD